MSGVKSPWTIIPRSKEPKEERDPTRFRIMSGRAYQLHVDTHPDRSHAATLGGFLRSLGDLGAREPMLTQGLSFRDADVPSPRLSIPLGESPLYAKASSTDLATATAMAIDRLALALNEVRAVHGKTLSDRMKAWGITIARRG